MPLGTPLAQRVNLFVEWLFSDYKTVLPRGPKVINDSLLGNQYFAKHEIAVIDSPVLQRLRRIKQTGLVYLVFPSATHSRFEHCLGAATLAEKCFTAIKDRLSADNPRSRNLITGDRLKGDLAHLRMAALLHDVGHGLCSHASEQIYEMLSDLKEFKNNPLYPQFTKNSPGEILSYLIIQSKTFRNWFEKYVVDGCKVNINLAVVSEMILGKHRDDEKLFLAQIISSPFDADKLDYIARDSFYCGLALTVDLPRFYSMIATARYKNKRVLALRNYVPLEQILFSKMTLYGSIYHHHKVKCLDSMLRSIVQHIHSHPKSAALTIHGARITFKEPVEYLYVTDDDFFNNLDSLGNKHVREMISRFMRRDLFVRCLEISRRTVKNWDTHYRKNFIDLCELPLKLHEVEKHIYTSLSESTRRKCNVGQVLLSVPKVPSMKSDVAFIQQSTKSSLEHIEDLFPVTQWTDTYAYNKWKSYMYAPREISKKVRDAAVSVLQDEMGLEIDLKKSNHACHI